MHINAQHQPRPRSHVHENRTCKPNEMVLSLFSLHIQLVIKNGLNLTKMFLAFGTTSNIKFDSNLQIFGQIPFKKSFSFICQF